MNFRKNISSIHVEIIAPVIYLFLSNMELTFKNCKELC